VCVQKHCNTISDSNREQAKQFYFWNLIEYFDIYKYSDILFHSLKIYTKTMDNLHGRLNFNLSKEKGIKHHS
jgi:hypothetical protein